MDLKEFGRVHVAQPSLASPNLLSSRMWQTAFQTTQNEHRTDVTVASVLAELLQFTEAFEEALLKRGLPPGNGGARETLLVAGKAQGDYVVLVADRELDPGDISSEHLRPSRADWHRALRRWTQLVKNRAGSTPMVQNLAQLGITDIQTGLLLDVPVWFTGLPRMIPVSAPAPAWSVTTAAKHRATAGCVVRHSDGVREGVTCARHLLSGKAVIGVAVQVDGLPGTVAEEDLMSDSIFIEMNSLPSGAVPTLSGWLSGIPPRVGGPAKFEGSTTGAVATAISATDPGLVTYSATRQARVYTPAVTSPGDSGAALIEVPGPHGPPGDRVVAFAHEVSPVTAALTWSSWIWADSVFTALGVKPK